MRKHYERILHDSESRVQRYLEIQILDENSPFCGGFPKADSLAEPKTAIYRATTMTACYLNPESRYYLDAELGRRLALALAFVRRSQRPGGYFDLINCNFFSGPDTAFCTKRLLPAYVYLCKVVDGALPAAPEAKAPASEEEKVFTGVIEKICAETPSIRGYLRDLKFVGIDGDVINTRLDGKANFQKQFLERRADPIGKALSDAFGRPLKLNITTPFPARPAGKGVSGRDLSTSYDIFGRDKVELVD